MSGDSRSDLEPDLSNGAARSQSGEGEVGPPPQNISVFTIEGTEDLPEPGTDIYGRSHTALSFLDDDVLPTMSDGEEETSSPSRSTHSDDDDSISLEDESEWKEDARGRSQENRAEEGRGGDEERWETWSRSTGHSKRPKVYYVQGRASSVSGAESRTPDWLHSFNTADGTSPGVEPLSSLDASAPVISIGSLGSPRYHRHPASARSAVSHDGGDFEDREPPTEASPLLRLDSGDSSHGHDHENFPESPLPKQPTFWDRILFWRSPSKGEEESDSDDNEFWLSPSGDEQEFTLDEDLLVTVKGYRKPFWKVTFFFILSVLSLGIVPLVCHWVPSLRVRLLFTSCPLRHARFVHITNNWDQEDVEPVERIEFGGTVEEVFPPDPEDDEEEEGSEEAVLTADGASEEGHKPLNGAPQILVATGQEKQEQGAFGVLVQEPRLSPQQSIKPPVSASGHVHNHYHHKRRRHSIKSRSTAPIIHPLPFLTTFSYHCYRFAYNPLTKVFHPILHWRDPSWESVPRALRGVPDNRTVEGRFKLFGPNLVAPPEVSILDLLVGEVLNPFYIFQICSIILWLSDSYYYYAVVIGLISLAGVIQTLIETRANMRRMREMARWVGEVWVWRPIEKVAAAPLNGGSYGAVGENGHLGTTHSWIKLTSDQLVPGDVFEIPPPKPPGAPPILSDDTDKSEP
ncbi:hypothetical protein HDU93_002871, partial [Gonapodya sp. JEL0774]